MFYYSYCGVSLPSPELGASVPVPVTAMFVYEELREYMAPILPSLGCLLRFESPQLGGVKQVCENL